MTRGARLLAWGVLSWNPPARDFHAALGASDYDARIREMDGESLARLAAEAES